MILLEERLNMAIKDPLIRKIFDDLDSFRDYCRFEGKVFKEASLYKKGDKTWESYMAWCRTQKKKIKRVH